jgi:hypothetical protein
MAHGGRRRKIVDYWMAVEPSFVDDPDVPSCFACGFDGSGEWGGWGTARLEEAHIIADSIGGKAEPSNLLLLCPRCHRDAPMSSVPFVLLDWVKRRESYVEFIWGQMSSAVAAIGFDEDQIARHVGLMSRGAIRAALRALRIDRHPQQLSPNFAGIAAAMKIWLDMQDGISRPAQTAKETGVRAATLVKKPPPASHTQARLPFV